MRSRFLNIDYFTLAPFQSSETLAFLHFPVPRLPSPPFNVEDHLQFHATTLDVSLHIDRLPVDDALSKFLSDVLPHRIDIDFHCFETFDPSSSHNCFSYSSFGTSEEDRISQEAEGVLEENEIENRIILKSEADIELESKMASLINKNQSIYNMIELETPELDVLLENTCPLEEVVMQMLYENSENEIHMNMLKPNHFIHFPHEVLDSVSIVEHVTSEYLTGQNAHFPDDYISFPNMLHYGQSELPILEVDEESLGILACSSVEENLGSHFHSVKPQKLDEKYHTVEDLEILGSMEHNVMEFLSVDCLPKQSVLLTDILHERDFIISLEAEQIHGNFVLQGKSQSESVLLENLITFQEYLFLDVYLTEIFESFYNKKALEEAEISERILKKELNCRNFDELIVGSEIALLDETCKSLPVPVISDYGKMIPLGIIIGDILSNLKVHPQSASDGIYLNWNLLEEDKSNCNYQSMTAKIDLSNIDFECKSSNDGRFVLDLVSSGDTLGGCDIKQGEELPELFSYCYSLPDDHRVGVSSSNLLDDESSKQGSGEQLAQRNVERVSLLFKSMSEVSHLDYFLNPQKVTASGNVNFAVESTNAGVNVSKVTYPELKALCRHSSLQSQRWNLDLHSVMLCDNIKALLVNFEKCYWAVLETETELTQTHNSSIDHFQLLRLPKCKLMKLHENGKNMAFIVLYAIKQASWYLCFYGFHPACLYVDKLCETLEYLKPRFSFLQSLIKDEKRKVDVNINASHPSLAVFEEILLSNNVKQDGLKVLIVAEAIFWWSLKSLLLSMGLSFDVLNNTYANQPYACNMFEDAEAEMKNLMVSDCLIVSYKHVSSFFPFNKFGIILEYGGPNDSSRISDLSPNFDGLPRLHFLKVDLDVHSAVKALCEGVEMPPNSERPMEHVHKTNNNIVNSNEQLMNSKLDMLLNFCTLEQNYDLRSSKSADEIDCSVPPNSARKFDHSHQIMESFPETIIIVNTQTVDKDMIVSRRSTYQVILSMEKKGAQVVERDLNFPVDIIISPDICLVWYDYQNLGKKATPVTEASSSVPLCVENIATNILTLLSISFGGCYLVFEGDVNFISTVMESSDGLYAAAASLGIHLQIFFSYLPELTNEIIVSCIHHATKLTRGMYPKMPDSVSLAESFLTQFPSINSFTAHAILSSGAMLTEFLGWSHEQRIHVLERYNVTEETISLVSALCKYGEREDSKSMMTDCSSSVSSGPDSDRCHLYQVDCERKRKNYMGIPKTSEPCFSEFLLSEPLHQVVDGFPDSSTLSKPCNPCDSKDDGRYTDLTDANLSMSDLFGPKQGFNVTTSMRRSPSRVSQPSYYKTLSVKDERWDQNDKLGPVTMNKNLTWRGPSYSEKLHEDIMGEVVDLTTDPLLNENFSSIVDSLNFPSSMSETLKDQKKNKISRRLSFDKSSEPEAKFSNNWRSLKDTPSEDDNNNPEPDFGMEVFALDAKYHEKISDEDLTGPSEKKSQRLQEMSHLGRTPLSRALQSASPLKSSPWTMEFINRIKEKSKLREKALSCENSAICFGYSGNMGKVANRRCPPIFELSKYQGSRTENVPQRKGQKHVQTLNSAKNGKQSASLQSSWTPKDKKAKKTLTFAMNESESQTKLIWNDETQHVTKKFRY